MTGHAVCPLPSTPGNQESTWFKYQLHKQLMGERGLQEVDYVLLPPFKGEAHFFFKFLKDQEYSMVLQVVLIFFGGGAECGASTLVDTP